MIGSAAIGSLIAHGAFWMLLVLGWTELRATRVAAFVALWLIGYAGSGWLEMGAAWFMAYVAALDIALVLMVFRGDIHLT